MPKRINAPTSRVYKEFSAIEKELGNTPNRMARSGWRGIPPIPVLAIPEGQRDSRVEFDYDYILLRGRKRLMSARKAGIEAELVVYDLNEKPDPARDGLGISDQDLSVYDFLEALGGYAIARKRYNQQ